MTILTPMSPEAFMAWSRHSIEDYAAENVRAGRWPEGEGALQRSREEFESTLPQGLATPDHHLFEIRDEATGDAVGVLWVALQDRRGVRGAYVYNVEVHAPYRRQGHARRAFEALERWAVAQGAPTIGLHVFGHNPGAQALYEQLGFRVTGLNMLKTLPLGATGHGG